MTLQITPIQSSQEYNEIELAYDATEDLPVEDTVESIVRPYRDFCDRQTQLLTSLTKQLSEDTKIQKARLEEIKKTNEEYREIIKTLQLGRGVLGQYKNELKERAQHLPVQRPMAKENESCSIFHAIASMVAKLWDYLFYATERE